MGKRTRSERPTQGSSGVGNDRPTSTVNGTTQIVGVFLLGSVIIAVFAWVLVPLLGAKDGSFGWAPQVNDILATEIMRYGWAMIGVAVALLAAGLVVLTITDLSGHHTIVTLKRDAVRNVVLAFLFTAVALLTLPAWGLLTGTLRIFLLQPSPFGEQNPKLTDAALHTALGEGINSVAIGAIAILVLWCASQLAEAVHMWISSDEQAVGQQRITALQEQRVRQAAALQRIENRFPPGYLDRIGVTRLCVRLCVRLFTVATTTLVLMLLIANFAPLDSDPTSEEIPAAEWITSALLTIIGPNIWAPLAGWALWLYVSLTATPRIVNGARTPSLAFTVLQILLILFGILASLGWPLLILLVLDPLSPYSFTLWAVGLLPQLLLWWPGTWGRLDTVLAWAARSDLTKRQQSTLKESARLLASEPAAAPVSQRGPAEHTGPLLLLVCGRARIEIHRRTPPTRQRPVARKNRRTRRA